MEGSSIKAAQPTRVRRFNDDSEIVYYDDGEILISKRPCNTLEVTPPPSQAELYYWQVMEKRPGIKTWDDIKRARKEG
jgi:hypothetical protein